MMIKNWWFALFTVSCLAPNLQAAVVVDFEELDVFTASTLLGDYYNGNDGSGATNDRGWTSQGVFFSNSYNGDSLPAFDFWSGWAYSNVVNPTDGSFTNQYASLPGGGSNGVGGVVAGQNYALAFGDSAYFNIPVAYQLQSIAVTNTTYAGLTIRDGSMFSKPFGGASGNDPDLFQITFIGYEALGASGSVLGEVTVDLADYRFADNTQDFVLDDWLSVDLSSLAGARSLGLRFFSTDAGVFGINTPTYVAVDNLTFNVVPEPSGLGVLLATLGAICLRRGHRSRS